MTTGERLLDLTLEYQGAKAARDTDVYGGRPTRAPEVIAANYEDALWAALVN